MNIKVIIKFFFGIFISFVFVALALKQFRFSEIKSVFLESDLKWILAAFAMLVLSYFFRIVRWREMLVYLGNKPSFLTCSEPFMASYAANNVLPFRMGDILRAFAFSKKMKRNYGEILATIFIERLLDFLMLLIFFCIVSMFLKIDLKSEIGISNFIPIFSIFLITILLFYPKFISMMALKIGDLLVAISPIKGKKIYEEIEKGMFLFGSLSKNKMMFKLIGLTFLSWSIEGLLYWFTAKAIPSLSVSNASWAAFPVGTLATLIPSAPGYIGTFDFFTMKTMIMFGNTGNSSAVYSFLVHFILCIPVTIVGGFFLIRHNLGKSFLKLKSQE